MKNSLKKKIIQFLSVAIFLLPAGACNPWKVTDPNDPRFKIENFKFEDYKSGQELELALEVAFPAGTSKEDVDQILLNKLGAKISAKNPDENSFSYRYRSLESKITQFITSGCAGYVIRIHYTQEDKLSDTEYRRGPC